MPTPRRDWSVAALLLSVFASAAAALAQATVLGKQVYDLTGRELDLGLLGLAEFAPAALLVLVTGSVADRVDRRRVAAIALLGESAVAGALAWYAGTKPTAVGPIFALAFAFGIARAFAAPASRSLPADTVAPERLPWLVARFSGAWQAALVVGPVLGGFLYAADIRLPYLAAAALLIVSAVAILSVRPRQASTRVDEDRAAADRSGVAADRAESTGGVGSASPPKKFATRLPERLLGRLRRPRAGSGNLVANFSGGEQPPRERSSFTAERTENSVSEAVAGLRFIRHQPLLLGAISLDLFAVLFGGAVALLPAIATDRLGVDAVGLGWLRAAGGLGAGAITLGLAVRPVRQRVGATLLLAVAGFGLATIVLGLTRNFAVAFVALAVLSGADSVSVFIRATLVPLVTPDDKRGRVLAVENVFIGASNELGAFESGVAGQLLGPAGAIVLGGVGTLLIAGGWWFLFPDLRRVDEFPGARSLPG
jgi:MFS family permease